MNEDLVDTPVQQHVFQPRCELRQDLVDDALVSFAAERGLAQRRVALDADVEIPALHAGAGELEAGEGQALADKGAVDKAKRNLARLQSICGDGCAPTRALAAAIQAASGQPAQGDGQPHVVNADVPIPAAATQN